MTCIFLCATPSISRGGEGRQFLETGDSLFDRGNYFAAAIEYERSYYLSDDPFRQTLANLSKARALKQMGAFDKALMDLQRSLPFSGADSLRFRVLYEVAFCSHMSGDHSGAHSYLRQIRYFFPDDPGLDRIRLLESLNLVQMEKWEELQGFLADSWLAEPVDSLARCMATEIAALLAPESLPLVRKPERARRYATFVPGLGHFYAGAPGSGLLNASSQLLSLGVFGFLALNGFYISSFTTGLSLFQSFYFGGIRQAGELTAAANNERMHSFKEQLSQMLISLEKHVQEQ